MRSQQGTSDEYPQLTCSWRSEKKQFVPYLELVPSMEVLDRLDMQVDLSVFLSPLLLGCFRSPGKELWGRSVSYTRDMNQGTAFPAR